MGLTLQTGARCRPPSLPRLEGIALVAILFLDWYTRREEHKETIAHVDIARKQIHADRVAEIWRAIRRFEYSISWGPY